MQLAGRAAPVDMDSLDFVTATTEPATLLLEFLDTRVGRVRLHSSSGRTREPAHV